MKKIILILLHVLKSISTSTRKSYITVYCKNYAGDAPWRDDDIILTGDVPDNIEGFEYNEVFHRWGNKVAIRKYSTGDILNLLSGYGFEVEFANIIGEDNLEKFYVLSKEIPSGQTVTEGDVNKDGEVKIADVNKLVNTILDIVRENPSILEQIKD